MNLSEFITPRVIAANYEQTASNRIPYFGEGLFPAEKKTGLRLAWVKGYGGLPVSLAPSAFDAQATYREIGELSRFETEMPFSAQLISSLKMTFRNSFRCEILMNLTHWLYLIALLTI